jgi:hypothetical protein
MPVPLQVPAPPTANCCSPDLHCLCGVGRSGCGGSLPQSCLTPEFGLVRRVGLDAYLAASNASIQHRSLQEIYQ